MAIFHILARADWLRAQRAGVYAPASLEREGFIHFSEDGQLLAVAERFFRGQDDLLVISVRRDQLAAELRYEEADGSSFPHLYGELNLDAVVEAVPLPRDGDGRFTVPVAWRPWAHYFEPRSTGP